MIRRHERNHGLRPFRGDVLHAGWVPFEPKEGFLASPPCPIFSNLTGAGGFASSINSGWDDLLFILRFVLPPLLLLENPTSMHQRLGEVREFMRVAGYRLQNIQSIQLANFSPMRRDRSISIWVRDTDLDTMSYDNSHPWRPHGTYHTLSSFSCIAPPELRTPELQISRQHRLILTDTTLVGNSTRAAAWAKHCVYPDQQAPTIQHRYVANLDMPRDRLLKFGLHCPALALPEPLEPRFFSPWEVARGLLFPQKVRLPHSVGQAWMHLGNSVSPLQCMAGLLTLDIARGRITRVEADGIVQRLIDSTVTLLDKRVVSRDGSDELVPVEFPLVADWEAFDDESAAPPRTITRGISSPTDTLHSSPRASDDSRAPKDGDQDRGSIGNNDTQSELEEQSPGRARRWSNPTAPEDTEIDTPERLLHDEMFRRISGLKQPLNPRGIPEERLLHGFPVGPRPEVSETIPDTIPWRPILVSSNTPKTQASYDQTTSPHYAGTSPQNQNQSALLVSPNMSRPIGGSSSRRTNMDEDEAEGSIPEPMTPPGCGQGSRRSRSPLPRYRIPRSHRLGMKESKLQAYCLGWA